MHRTNPFTQLAARAVQGDRAARRQLRHALQPQLVRMVRHALEDGGTTAVARRILATAREVANANHTHDDVVQAVAEALCDSVMAQLPSSPSSGAARETVCA